MQDRYGRQILKSSERNKVVYLVKYEGDLDIRLEQPLGTTDMQAIQTIEGMMPTWWVEPEV